MTNSINLTEKQTDLKSKLESLYNQVWEYIESDGESLSKSNAAELYNDMACILRTSCHVYTAKMPHRHGVLATVTRQLPHHAICNSCKRYLHFVWVNSMSFSHRFKTMNSNSIRVVDNPVNYRIGQ